jgi:DNA-binding response OmpR family regulator
MRTLIVEDQGDLAEEIKSFLEKERYVCDIAATFIEASEKLSVNPFDFVLIDLGLPDGDGMTLLQEAKKTQKTAIFIIITARGEIQDKVEGLSSGADDYLAKPFSFLELKARMQAILRRKSGWNDSAISFSEFVMDTESRTVSHQGKDITLTKKEFDLLYFLLIHKNKVINRYQLAEHIWGEYMEDDHQSNFIDVHVKNVRKKLGVFAPVDWLETVRGVGYRIQF